MRDWFKRLFSDSQDPSYARVASAFALICSAIWVFIIVIKTGRIPDLLGVSALVCGLYGMGKVNDTIRQCSTSANSKTISQ